MNLNVKPAPSPISLPLLPLDFIPISRNSTAAAQDEIVIGVGGDGASSSGSLQLRPYPVDSIRRVSEHVKYLFSDRSPFVMYESNQGQRTFEIIKLKLGMPSRFTGDASMMRRLERQREAAQRTIDNRVRQIDARISKHAGKKEGKHEVIDLCSSSEDNDNGDTEIKQNSETDEDETDEEDRDEIMRLIAREDCINLDDDDEEDEEEEDEEDDEKDDEKEQDSEGDGQTNLTSEVNF